jgi:hypothetical protein
VIIARRKSLNESLRKPLKADLVQDEESVDSDRGKA